MFIPTKQVCLHRYLNSCAVECLWEHNVSVIRTDPNTLYIIWRWI